LELLTFTHILNGLLMIAIPVALAILLKRRFKHSWVLYFSGVLGFILSQVGHIPFNSLITMLFQRGILPSPPESYTLLFNAIVLGLSAGLWEELVRYGMMRWWIAKPVRTWSKAVFFGSGWGGVEAILLGIVTLYAFVQLTILRTVDLSGVLSAEQWELAQQQIQAYWSTPWGTSLLGAYERLWAIVLQIFFTVLVLQAFTRGRAYWLWLAVAGHAAVDALAVYVMGRWGALPAEGVLTVIGLLALAGIFALRQPDPVEDAEPPPTALPVLDASSLALEPTVTAEKLDDSRYQ
jgi:uncharacterized membrane protein YhfC